MATLKKKPQKTSSSVGRTQRSFSKISAGNNVIKEDANSEPLHDEERHDATKAAAKTERCDYAKSNPLHEEIRHDAKKAEDKSERCDYANSQLLQEDIKHDAKNAVAEIRSCDYANSEALHEEERHDAKIAAAKSQRAENANVVSLHNFAKMQKFWQDAISRIDDFQSQLLAYYTQDCFVNTELYKLLNTYLKSRCRVVTLVDDLYSSVAEARNEAESAWVEEVERKVFQGCCGDNRTVKINREYALHYLDEVKLSHISSMLANIRKTAYENLLPDIFNCQKIKSEIQYIIGKIVADVNVKVAQNGNIYFTEVNNVGNQLEDIHLAVSILFYYLRKPVEDETFVNDVKLWIQQLEAAQMHLTQPEEPWFILFHLLRCPNKISWGIPMVQIPYLKVNEILVPDVNICITLLKMLTSPVNERGKMLSTKTNDSWVILDSDYEEDSFVAGNCIGLREDDIIGLLNQIPFEDLFCSIVNAKKIEGEYKISVCYLSELSVLQLFAFNSIVIETLGEGLSNYCEERYKLLRRRFALLIQHCIHFSHYCYQSFLKAANCDSSSAYGMLNSVFDQLVFVACKYLHKSKDSGVLQFLLFIPFNAIRENTLCAIFHYLNVGFPEDFNFASDGFSVQHSQIQNEISYMVSTASADMLDYLLQIYLQMALCKNHTVSFKFVQIVCQHIFNIGYCDERTRSTCNRTCNNILFTLTEKYPQLIDDLITYLAVNFPTIEGSECVFQSMELSKWQPNKASLEVVLQWLAKYSYDSKENGVARSILGHMNWGLDSENQLFIAHRVHVRVAYGVLEAACNEIERKSNSAKDKIEKFIDWCWNMISLLRLHYLDQGPAIARNFLNDPSKYLNNLPEANDIEILVKGVSNEFPLAIYLSMLTTLNGHSIPLACQKSFQQLQLLLLDKRYVPSIRGLQLLTGIFAEYSDVLNECKSFQDLLSMLIQADKSRMGVTLLFKQHPTSTVEIMKNMIQSQIINYADYGLPSCQPLINLWLKSLLCLPNAENQSVLYLLDNILKVAYSPQCWGDAKQIFISCYEKHLSIESLKSFTAHLFKKGVEFYEAFPWYILMRLEVEHTILERKTNLWDEILLQVNIGGLKFEDAFKRAIESTGSQYSHLEELTVFKYANFIAAISSDHILLPILSQQFFAIYLHRSCRITTGERHNSAISNTIYNHNSTLMLKIKTQFCNAAEYYNKKNWHISEGQEAPRLLHKKLNRLFTAYQTWLDDTIVGNASLGQIINLPKRFYPEKLITIVMFGEKNHWNEFLNVERIASELKCNSDCWREHCFRSFHNAQKKETNVNVQVSNIDPSAAIFKRLAGYEKPCKFDFEHSTIGKLSFNNKEIDLLKLVKTCLKSLLQYARYLRKAHSDMADFDSIYIGKLRRLYKITSKDEFKRVSCNSIFSSPFSKCSRPALIKLTVKLEQYDQDVHDGIACNRKNCDELFNGITTDKHDENILPLETLLHIARELNDYYAGKTEEALLGTPGSKLFQCYFHELVRNFNNDIVLSPLKEVYEKLILFSGIYMDIHQKTEGVRMMIAAMQNTALFNVLADMINPMKGDFECFVNMYKTLIEAHRQFSPIPYVVAKLAPKFNMASCMVRFSPNTTNIRILLKLTFQGLANHKHLIVLHETLRRNFIDILKHQFPENMSEGLLATLAACSHKTIDRCIIQDIITLLVNRNNEEAVTSNIRDIYTEISQFANTQTYLDIRTATELTTIIATHFQSERVKSGLHGLYPVYENYCEQLAILLACLSQAAIAASLKNHSEFDTEIFDRIIKSVFEVYSPWIMVYMKPHYQNNAESWTCQLAEDGKLFFPWSEFYAKKADTILFSLLQTLKFLLPFGPEVMMSHIFDWYCDNIASEKTPSFILEPIQAVFMSLDWQYFCPQSVCLEKMYKTINKTTNNTDRIIGCIFINVMWSKWFNNHFIRWKYAVQVTSLKFLLFIAAKTSLDPKFYSNEHTKRVIKDLLTLPWEEVSYEYVEEVFDWILRCHNPEILFEVSSSEEDSGINFMSLLRRASAMNDDAAVNGYQLIGTRRRAYVHYIMNLLHVCISKNNTIVENRESRKKIQFVLMNTLTDIDKMNKIEIQELAKKQNDEILILFKEVFSFDRFQNSSMTKFCIDVISSWVLNYATRSASIVQILNVISSTKSYDESMCFTLECTLEAYLKLTENGTKNLVLDWNTIALKMGELLEHISLITLIREKHLLTLHLLIMYKVQTSDLECKKILVNDLINILKTLEPSENLEMKIANVWAATISLGLQISAQAENTNKKLLEFARNLQVYNKDFNSWKNGILVLVGLKQTNVTKKFLMLSECLACIIFDFLGERDALHTSITRINTFKKANKEDELNVLILKALDIIEGTNGVSGIYSNKVIILTNTFYEGRVLNLRTLDMR